MYLEFYERSGQFGKYRVAGKDFRVCEKATGNGSGIPLGKFAGFRSFKAFWQQKMVRHNNECFAGAASC